MRNVFLIQSKSGSIDVHRCARERFEIAAQNAAELHNGSAPDQLTLKPSLAPSKPSLLRSPTASRGRSVFCRIISQLVTDCFRHKSGPEAVSRGRAGVWECFAVRARGAFVGIKLLQSRRCCARINYSQSTISCMSTKTGSRMPLSA